MIANVTSHEGKSAMRARITRTITVMFCLFALGATDSGCSRALVARDTLAALDAASAGFQTWDKEHQEQLRADNTPEVAQQLIAGYRKKREHVMLAFTLAYTAVGVATLKNPADALEAFTSISSELKALGSTP